MPDNEMHMEEKIGHSKFCIDGMSRPPYELRSLMPFMHAIFEEIRRRWQWDDKTALRTEVVKADPCMHLLLCHQCNRNVSTLFV